MRPTPRKERPPERARNGGPSGCAADRLEGTKSAPVGGRGGPASAAAIARNAALARIIATADELPQGRLLEGSPKRPAASSRKTEAPAAVKSPSRLPPVASAKNTAIHAHATFFTPVSSEVTVVACPQLPLSMLTLLFGLLEKLEDVTNVSLVCKSWRRAYRPFFSLYDRLSLLQGCN